MTLPDPFGMDLQRRALEDWKRAQYEAMRTAMLQQNYLGALGGLGGLGAQQAIQPFAPPPPPPPAPKIEYAGTKFGEIEAWRAWIYIEGFIRSAYRNEVWAPGEPMTGKLDQHGVHAWKTRSQALTYGMQYFVADKTRPVIIGRVALWDGVIVHEHGYRAESAKVLSFEDILAAPAFNGEAELVTLRTKYGLAQAGEARSAETPSARPEG